MELEVWLGARGPGDGGQEAEGSEAGGAGAATSGLVAHGAVQGSGQGLFPSGLCPPLISRGVMA